MNFLVQLAVLVIANLISQALAPKPPKPKPAAISDFDVPVAEQGRPVPVVFGTVLVRGPNVIWYDDLSTTPIRSRGGKK